MFDSISKKFTSLFSVLSRNKQLTEQNLQDAIREIRVALLEADVDYEVAKKIIHRVKEETLGQAVLKSVTPAQQFIKIVHDEMVRVMGSKESELLFSKPPSVYLLCGLQGSGKTTQAAKLVHFLKKSPNPKKVWLVACDLQRPGAVEQLHTLGQQVDAPVFSIPQATDPVQVAEEGVRRAKAAGADVVILDTAGRLQIDQELMLQLKQIHQNTQPVEVLLVVNAALGQEAVQVARSFDEQLGITGCILTMLDGDARGGVALSLFEVTGKPIKFEGVGEKIKDLRYFNPVSMADRILGMGDAINLVKQAQEVFSEQEAEDLEQKLRKSTVSYNDYLKHLQSFKKMGPFKQLLKMLPGADSLPELAEKEKEFYTAEAIILSMTPRERMELDPLEVSRCKRIARGSGTHLDEVYRLRKNFQKMKQFFKNMPNEKQLEKYMGGKSWR